MALSLQQEPLAQPAGTPAAHPEYRPDIDGLRAIAVVSVLIFHAFPSALRGGFAGVDIFFVISGFLITSIILTRLQSRSFSFLDFYRRRVLRIFPVLMLVLAFCYALGWLFLLPDEFKQLGRHILGGAGFHSNLLLWTESGYFDNAAETKPLLHLWSLGVEEQFYFIWPALLYWGWKRGLNLLTLTLLLTALSFGINLGMVYVRPSAAFYLPHARFWQLLVGALLAWLALHGKLLSGKAAARADRWLGIALYARPPAADGSTLRNTLSLLGAGMVLAALALLNKNRVFPGWWAVLPTVGTALVIAAGGQAWVNRKLLSQRGMVWIGLISFPLYLWHWPLLSLARLWQRGEPALWVRWGLLAAAFVLAWLSYRLVEKPLRFGRRRQRNTLLLLALALIAALAGYLTWKRDGLGFRMKGQQEFAAYFENAVPVQNYFLRTGIFEAYHVECEFYDLPSYRAGRPTLVPVSTIAEHCYRRDPKKAHAVMLWGDSHAEHLSQGIRNRLPADWQVLQVTSSGCHPDADVQQGSEQNYCQQSNWFALKTVQEARPDVVLVAQNRGQTVEKFQRIAQRLRELGVPRVVLVGPVPFWEAELPKLVMSRYWMHTPRRIVTDLEKAILEGNAHLQKNFPQSEQVVFADLLGVLCNQEGCLSYLGDDRMRGITSYDQSHLTPATSDYVAGALLARLITGPKP